MNEVKKVVNIPINKKCPRCGKMLPSAFFSKKTKSKDGLQDYCKSCLSKMLKQSRKNKKKRLHNNELAVLSYNAKKNGLQYHFIEQKKKNGYRKNIIYKCLDCEREVQSSISEAIKNKFKCSNCLSLDNENKILKKQYEYNKNLLDNCDNHCEYDSCNCHQNENCKEINEVNEIKDQFQLTQQEHDEIMQRIKEIRERVMNQKQYSVTPHIHVFVIQSSKVQENKKGFWSKIKNLFHRS